MSAAMLGPFGYVVLLVVLTLVGAVMAKYPRSVAAFNETVDAIGSRRNGPVEPADWQVTFVRYGGIALTLFGSTVLLLLLWAVVG